MELYTTLLITNFWCPACGIYFQIFVKIFHFRKNVVKDSKQNVVEETDASLVFAGRKGGGVVKPGIQ